MFSESHVEYTLSLTRFIKLYNKNMRYVVQHNSAIPIVCMLPQILAYAVSHPPFLLLLCCNTIVLFNFYSDLFI
jgi:hypothetical protein